MTGTHRSQAKAVSRTRGSLRRRFRPRLEELEPRVLLSTSIPLSPTSWVDIGPAPIGNGQVPGNQAVSGRVTGLATDPTTSDIIYAATAGGGVWKTTNGGTSWFPTMDNLSLVNGGGPLPMFMGAVAVAPNNPQVVYAGSGEANNSIDSYYGLGVWVSTNGGSTWNLSGPDRNALQGSAIAQIVVDPLVPTTAWAAVSRAATNGTIPPAGYGIYMTINGGVDWTNVTAASLPGTTGVSWSAVVIDPTTSTRNNGNATLFAAVGRPTGSVNNGIYRSTNSGGSWTLVDNLPFAVSPPGATTGGRIALALSHPDNIFNATIYASVATAQTPGKNDSTLLAFDVSTNGGTVWTQQMGTPEYMNGFGWYGNVVQADTLNFGRVYVAGAAGGQSIFESSNFGRPGSWVPLDIGTDPKNPNGPHADHHALAIDHDFRLVDGNDGGVWRLDTNDIADPNKPNIGWKDLNSNLEITQFTGIALDPGNTDIVHGGSQDNGTELFVDSGIPLASPVRQWTQVRTGDGGFVRVDPSNHQTVYHTYFFPNTPNPFIERSDNVFNATPTWTNITSGINLADPSNFYPPYVIDPNNSNRLVLGTSRLYETLTRGNPDPNFGNNSWHPLGTAPSAAKIDWIAIAPSDSNTIYVGAGGALYVTTDNAKTWTTITPPVTLAAGAPTGVFPGIVVNPNDPRTAYVVVGAFTTTGSGEVWQTTDRGATWTDITGTGLPTGPIRSITLFPPTSLVFVGTDVGVFATNQVFGASTQWVQYAPGMPNAQVVDLETAIILPTQGVLAAATHGRGVFEIQVPNLVTITSVTPPSGVQEGNDYSSLFLGTFVSSDPNLGAGDFTAKVIWGDRSGIETYTGGPNGNGGIVFDAAFGLFRLVAHHRFREEGPIPVFVSIFSNALPFITSRASGTASVTDAPLLLTVVTPNAVEGQSNRVIVAKFFDNNPFADINDFSAFVTYNGGGGVPKQLMLNAANGGIIPFFGPQGFAVLDNVPSFEEGDVPFSVNIVDAGEFSVSQNDTVHVADAPLTFLAVTPPAGLTEGASSGRRTLARFADTADNGLGTDINDYATALLWGDGTFEIPSAANGGIVPESPSGFGPFDIVAEHRYTEEGTALPFTISVGDRGGSPPISRTVPVDIADAPLVFDSFTPPAPLAEGSQSFGTVATFSDPGGNTSPDDFTATVTWGDGTVSSLFGPAGGPGGAGQLGIVFQNGHFVVFSNHIWDETPPGGGTLTVRVTDVGGAPPIVQSAPIVVADNGLLTLVTPPAPVTLVEGQGTLFGLTLLTFSDPGFPSYETTADYTAVVDWGDGTPVGGGTVVPLGGGLLGVRGFHTYADEVTGGTLTVTVTDVGGQQVSAQATVNVADAPLSLSNLAPPSAAVEGRNTGRLQLATLVDASPFRPLSDYQAVVAWGDGTTDTLTAASGNIVSIVSGVGLMGAHTYNEELNNGTFTITVTDDGGMSASQSRAVSVGDAALTVTFNLPQNPVAGVPTGRQTLATWTDADPNGAAGDYTVQVTWGDQTNNALTAANGGVVDNGDGTFSAVADHTFGRTGLMGFSVVVQDAGISSPGGAGIFVRAPVPLLLPVTTLAANPNPSRAGQSVTFTATVTPAAAGQPTPVGTVTFKDGDTALATVPLGSVTTVSAAGTTTAVSLADWYKGEGNALDSTQSALSARNGTLQGGATFAPGRVGQAFSFDGAANSLAQFGGIFGLQPFGTADFAVAFWLQTTAAGPQAVLGNRVTAGDGNFYSVRMTGGLLVAELDQDAAGTNDVSLTSIRAVNDGAFHHVALVRSGTTLSLYLDGTLDGSAAAAGVTNLTLNRLVAGAEPAADLVPAFTGLLDEIQVYRRAPTGQEVQAIFTAGSAGLTSNNAILIISTIPAGMHSITVTYNGGDGIFAPSTSGPPVIWPVMHAATTTALAASVNATLFGQPVTFTATVSVVSPGGTAVAPPGGTVTFADGATTLGTGALSTSNGITTATFSTSSLAGGAHSITATYGGDANFLASSTAHVLRQTITYGTASERLVARLYLDLLGRAVEDAGLQFWSALLNQGVSTSAVVGGIQGSLEYRTHMVNDLYRQFLRRDADALGLGAATAFLGTGGTAAHLEAILVGSPEYYQREGGASADGFLTAMYHDVLGRAVDAPSRVYLDQVLTAGARRGDIAAAVFASTEFDALWVESLYQTHLGRPSDSLGLATFVNGLHAGFSQEQVLAAILSSPEYAGRR